MSLQCPKCPTVECTLSCNAGYECALKINDCKECYIQVCFKKDSSVPDVVKPSSGINSGMVIGIVCGVLGIIGIGLAIFLIIRARRRKRLERILQGANYSGEFNKEGLTKPDDPNIYGIQSIFSKADINHLNQGFYSDNEISMNQVKDPVPLPSEEHKPILSRSLVNQEEGTSSSHHNQSNNLNNTKQTGTHLSTGTGTGTSLTNISNKHARSTKERRTELSKVNNFDINAPLPTPKSDDNEVHITKESALGISAFKLKDSDRFQNEIV